MGRYSHPQGHVFYRKMGHGRPQIAHAEGIYLYDEAGKRYIDGTGGPLVVNVGHGRQEVVQAITKQAQAVAYAHAIMFTSEPAELFSAELAKIVPLPEARFFYLSSGSEVVEAAIKLARQIQMARGENGRHLIISRWGSYHGLSLGALSVSGRQGMRRPYLPMLREMPHIDPPYPYRDPVSGREAADRLEAAILDVGPEQVAGFLAEPISGAGLGAIVPPADYWPRIRQICDHYGILLIADEVLVGLGRTGKMWALDHWHTVPDIMVTSKGLAGGYFPLGFVAAKGNDVEQIRQTLGDFNHGGTFSHHAVGTAAGLATLQIIQRENLVENAAVIGDYLGQKLHHAFSEHSHVGDIRGKGLFWALELVEDRESKKPFPVGRHLAWDIWQQAFDRGLVSYYSQGCADGTNGDLVMLGPPLIVKKDQIDEMVAILAAAIQAEIGG